MEPDSHKANTFNEQSKVILNKLTEAIAHADVEKVKQLLSDDVRLTSDGGNNVRAARKIISGKEHVIKFLHAIYGKYLPPDSESHLMEINHNPAIIFKQYDKVYRCVIFEMSENSISNIYIVVNPDKLQSL